MALSTNGSYLFTADQFLSHWESSNSTLPPGTPVITAAGIDRAGLQDLRTALSLLFDNVTASINAEEIARDTMDKQKEYVRGICVIFNEAVRGRLTTTSYPAALAHISNTSDPVEDVISNAADVLSLWGIIDEEGASPGFTPPLTIPVTPIDDPEGEPIDMDLILFDAEKASLDAKATAHKGARQKVVLERNKREKGKRKISNVMRDYRAAIPGFFTEGDPIRESLPHLYPAPGHTPDPVVPTAVWDEVENMAKISFGPSTDPTLQRYSIRYCPGPVYSTDDEVSIGSIEPGEPLEFLTLAGLGEEGATANYRVYVILTTGNEKGSNTVTVTRPLSG